MTLIRRISGTVPAKSQQIDTAAELRQRGALVKPASFVDTVNWSAGEMLVHLIGERYKMLSEFYPENRKLKEGYILASNALYNGLHNNPAPLGSLLDPALHAIAAAIVRGKGMTRPASGYFGWKEKARTPVSGIGNPFVPQVDCATLYKIQSEAAFNAGGGFGTGLTYNQYQTAMLKKQQACNEENSWRLLLNDKWEKVSHHPIYEFEASPASKPPIITTKAILHKNGIGAIASLSKIERYNIREWQHNGILRQNIAQGGGTISPEETINGIKQAHDEHKPDFHYVGILPIAGVVAIIGAITAAIGAATSMLLAIKQKNPTAASVFAQSTQGWGTDNWTGQPSDWEMGNNEDNSGSNGNNGSNGNAGIDLSNPAILVGGGIAALGLVWALTNKN